MIVEPGDLAEMLGKLPTKEKQKHTGERENSSLLGAPKMVPQGGMILQFISKSVQS